MCFLCSTTMFWNFAQTVLQFENINLLLIKNNFLFLLNPFPQFSKVDVEKTGFLSVFLLLT